MTERRPKLESQKINAWLSGKIKGQKMALDKWSNDTVFRVPTEVVLRGGVGFVPGYFHMRCHPC